jgi:hypothetical protein
MGLAPFWMKVVSYSQEGGYIGKARIVKHYSSTG